MGDCLGDALRLGNASKTGSSHTRPNHRTELVADAEQDGSRGRPGAVGERAAKSAGTAAVREEGVPRVSKAMGMN